MNFNLRSLLRFWIYLFVIVLIGTSCDAGWGFRRIVKSVKKKIFKKPVPPVPVAEVIAKCPSDFRVIPISDALDAAQASKQAYEKKTSVGQKIPGTDYIVDYQYKPPDMNVKVIIAKKGNTRIIAFRGTADVDQLEIQFKQGIEDVRSGRNAQTIGTTRTRVLSFMWRAEEKLLIGIKEYLRTRKSPLRYIITGHSLGGALGSLFALKAKYIDELKPIWKDGGSSLITFGAPKVGNTAFAHLHDRAISPNKKIRFVFGLDPAPHVPFKVGTGQEFTHHSREVWLTTKLKLGKSWWGGDAACWKVCTAFEDKYCSKRKSKLSWMFPLQHNIKNYIDSLKSPPTIMYDKNEHDDKTWEKVMTKSCSS